MEYPKLLIIANEALSDTTSNSRTLSKYFTGWPKEKLAQFCLSLNDPNYNMCDNYFCVTDSDAINCFINGSKALSHPTVEGERVLRSNASKRSKTMMLATIRHIIWSSRRWEGDRFKKWVDDFNPDGILLLSSDAMFLFDLALDLAKNRKKPLIIFNAEGYYFFKKNFYRSHFLDFVFFPLFMNKYRKHYKRLMNYASCSVFLNSMLKEDYDREFGRPSIVLYTSSDLPFEPKQFNQEAPTFSYLGNLVPNRQYALVDIATCLNKIREDYKLDVYGSGYDYEEKMLKECPYINFHGRVSYSDVLKIMKESDVLFHAETSEERWSECLRYGFSTKIADSLSSGSNFFLYAPPSIACSKYIKETGAAWYADSKETLSEQLYLLLTKEELRQSYLDVARKISSENHNIYKNAESFRNIVIDAITKFEKSR